MIKVYIASPYTNGDKEENVKRQIGVASELIDKGFAPYVPLLSHYVDIEHKKDYQKWIDIDMSYLQTCDVLLRLSGISNGADLEVNEAERIGMRVFHSVADLCNYFNFRGDV